MNPGSLPQRMIGYRVHSHAGDPIGEVEAVRERGVRLRRRPGPPGRLGYLPAAAIAAVDHGAGEVITVLGIPAEAVADAPPPPDERLDAWHTSAEWWSDLMGHYGLYHPVARTDLRATVRRR